MIGHMKMMIKSFLERRRLHKLFAAYVSPATADMLLAGDLQSDVFRHSEIDFALVAVRDDNPEQASKLIHHVTETALANRGFVNQIVSPVVIVTFGMVAAQPARDTDRANLVRTLTRELGNDIKVVHGSGLADIGNIGAAGRLTYAFVIRGFLDALAELAALSFGEAKVSEKVKPTSPQ